jgi:hypothetical protein
MDSRKPSDSNRVPKNKGQDLTKSSQDRTNPILHKPHEHSQFGPDGKPITGKVHIPDVNKAKMIEREKIIPTERIPGKETREVSVSLKKLTVVTTDFGADCDDQKAVLGLIQKLKKGKEIAFIVGGPHPRLAAAAIAQRYHQATGRYPLITLGQQSREVKIPEDRIYSLVDGKPIRNSASFVDALLVSPQEFQHTIDAKVREGGIQHFVQIVLAPLYSELEYYNPGRQGSAHDNIFHEKWSQIRKTATTQFDRIDEGTYKGFNYLNSESGIVDSYLTMLQNQGFKQVYVDGATAKFPEFLLTMKQPEQPGIQKAIEAYIALKQVPWLYMTEALGETPNAENMHVGMFTSGAQVPFGVHTSGKNPAGFGAERLMKEVCNISLKKAEEYTAAMKPIVEELEKFDQQVLTILQRQHPTIASVQEMRAVLHTAMMDALQKFGERKKILDTGKTAQGFKELFKIAADKCIPLNAYTYMQDFKDVLFEMSPLAKEITNIAEDQKNKTRADDTNHVRTIVTALGERKKDIRAVMFDAVATEASRVVRNNGELQQHFTEGNGIINITAEGLKHLQQEKPDLYAVLREGIREGLARDGSQLYGKT